MTVGYWWFVAGSALGMVLLWVASWVDVRGEVEDQPGDPRR